MVRIRPVTAADHRLTNGAHAHHLPPSWMTLYELTKMPDDVFEAKIVDGTAPRAGSGN
jgi:hypothetical protein